MGTKLHSACDDCRLYTSSLCKFTFEGSTVGDDPKLIVIASTMSTSENRSANFMDGDDFRTLARAIDFKYDYYYTKLIKCYNPEDPFIDDGIARPPNQLNIDSCSKILAMELKRFPSVDRIMTLGQEAFKFFVPDFDGGFTENVGKAFEVEKWGRKFMVIPNFSGGYVAHNVNRVSQFKSIVDNVFNAKPYQHIQDRSVILNYEESMEYLERITDLYGKREIDATVFDLETTSLDVFKCRPLMASFCHDVDPRGVVIPFEVNNNIHMDKVRGVIEGIHPDIVKTLPMIERWYHQVKEGTEFTDNNVEIIQTLLKHQGELQIMSVDLPLLVLLSQYKPVDLVITPQQSLKLQDKIRHIVETVKLIGHNLKYDIKVSAAQFNVKIEKVRQIDTLTLGFHLHGRMFGAGLGLKELAKKHVKVVDDWDSQIELYLSQFRKNVDKHFGNIPTCYLADYSGLDSYYNRLLYHDMIDKLPESARGIFYEMNECVVPYAEAEFQGVAIDEPMMDMQETKFLEVITGSETIIQNLPVVKRYFNSIVDSKWTEQEEKLAAKRRIKPKTRQQFWEETFTLTSPLQTRELMYTDKGYNLPVIQDFMTDGGKSGKKEPQTGADVIEYFLKKAKVDGEVKIFLSELERYKLLNKLYTTYLKGKKEDLIFGTMKPEFNLTGTVSGRFSSGFHTLPSKSDIKRIYTSRWIKDGGLFLCCDYSQLEVRIGASIAKEYNLIKAYEQDIDIHTATGLTIQKILQGRNDLTLDDITKEQRSYGKTINFGIFYGKGVKSLAEEMGIPEEKAQIILDGFMKGNNDLAKWIQHQHDFVMRHGYVITPFGNKLPVPDAFSKERGIQNAAKRQGVNYPVQGSASFVGAIGANKIYKDTKAVQDRTLFLGMVHDSMEFDIFPGELPRMVQRIKYHSETKIREDYPWIICPLKMDFSIGTSWGSAIEFSIKELTDKTFVAEGEAMNRDYRSFIAYASNGYKVDSGVLKEEPLDVAKFPDDIIVRDTKKVKFQVSLTTK